MRFLLSMLAALAVATPVSAADMARYSPTATPFYNWTGVYIGVNGGVGAFDSTTTDYTGALNFGIGGDFSRNEVGGFAGGTIGYNAQFGRLVLGVEADLQWASFEAKASYSGSNVNNSAWDWFGTLRVRSGVAVDNALIYVTAGGAFADTDYVYGRVVNPGAETVSSGDVQWGLAAGAGVEYAFTDHWTAKAEYLYIGLPSTSARDSMSGDYDFKSHVQIGRAGLNYKF